MHKGMAAAAVPAYRPALIEAHAAELYARARSARLLGTAIGAALGTIVGAPGALLPLAPAARIGTAAIWILAAALLGRASGSRCAERRCVRAQLLLCGVHAQYGTLAVWRTLEARLPKADVVPFPRQAHAAEAAEALPPPLSSRAL
jgi:hypothetical protein